MSSTAKVSYDIRPKKQIERRMTCHALQGLSEIGFPISKYQYTGLGSVFFIDFILFRKMLGMYDMLSVEKEEKYRSRVLFNKPYKDIDTEIRDVGECIPGLDGGKRHLLWLDYDNVMQDYMAEHVVQSLMSLTSGSVLIVTIDVDFDAIVDSSNQGWFEQFQQVEPYLPPDLEPDDCNYENISHVTIQTFKNIINNNMGYRKDMTFQPMFNFLYADGHEMLTIGGILLNPEDKEFFNTFRWDEFSFLRNNYDDPPYHIDIPVLTRKERLYLDTWMPAKEGWKPKDFVISEEQLNQYKEVYKYFPQYGELLF